MSLHDLLYSKNGYSTKKLALEFIRLTEGSRIPTVSELNEKIGLARGTIQNALKMLTEKNAVELNSRGAMGTFLTRKNMRQLLDFAGIDSIVGAMPLPYSVRYEGLATGLISGVENVYDLPVSLAYMRGAECRISMVLAGRYDFAIVSRMAAEQVICEKKLPLKIIKSFGPGSYLGAHVILFHDRDRHQIEDGMKVGIDRDSIDQATLTGEICQGHQVEFVPMTYNQVTKAIREGVIDAAVWNEDEVVDKMMDIPYKVIETCNNQDREAVMVVDGENETIASLLEEMISTATVCSIQNMVTEGKMAPSY